MTDANQNAGTSAAANNGKDSGASDANKNTDNGAGAAQIDTSKWTEADWDKVYNDPKLYNNPRFKGLNERAKRATELENQQAEAEKAKLAEQKEFQKLAEVNKKEAETWKSKAQDAARTNAIVIAAQAAGVADTDAVVKLLDKSAVTIDENGNVTGASEAVKALVESKPYLKGKTATAIGSSASPGSDSNSIPTFKLSQLNNARFYRAHEAEIMRAQAAGKIINDTGQVVQTS